MCGDVCYLFCRVCSELFMTIRLSSTCTLLAMLFVADYRSSTGSGAVVLDDCNFHESVRLDSFDIDRTLSLVSEISHFS